jgi:hypothetical protein
MTKEMAMSKRRTRKARKATVTIAPPIGMDPDDFQQQFRRWQANQRFLIEHNPRLAEKARKLGILPNEPKMPPSEH